MVDLHSIKEKLDSIKWSATLIAHQELNYPHLTAKTILCKLEEINALLYDDSPGEYPYRYSN